MGVSPVSESNDLSDLLVHFRDILEQSQKEVADAVEIPPPSLSFYENGRRIPPFPILIKLLDHYDAQLKIETDLGEWVFDVDDEKEIELEEREKTEEMGLLSGLEDQEKEDLIAYVRRRRRHTEE
jgi:transcriptional regulator with XRE-family HTH domain